MHREIGSNFWIDRYKSLPEEEIILDYLGIPIKDVAFLSTGRSAISYVLEHIESKTRNLVALLPQFTCYTVIEPFLAAGYEVYYYEVNKQLECNITDLQKSVERYGPSVILFHGYFGFNTLSNLKDVVANIRDNGVVVIEDVTQTLYSEFEHLCADYYIASLRKWGPLPDGGFAISAEDTFKSKPQEIDIALQEAKMQALHAKHLYMTEHCGEKTHFLELFRKAEAILSGQQGYYAISDFSSKVQANLDLVFLRKRRRANFETLLQATSDISVLESVFYTLPEQVTPLFFPVYIIGSDRRSAQDFLAKHDIYCPVIWPKPRYCENVVSETVDWIYDHILAIPCDQRYGNDDMERVGDALVSLQKQI